MIHLALFGQFSTFFFSRVTALVFINSRELSQIGRSYVQRNFFSYIFLDLLFFLFPLISKSAECTLYSSLLLILELQKLHFRPVSLF